MSDLSLIPLQDWYESQLSQDWDGATGTVYVLATPSYTPTTTNTYIVVNPWKTNMQIAEITDYDSTAKTLTVSSISFEKGLGISSTAQSHSTGSKVIISDNYQFWEDIQTAVNSKLDDTGGTMTGLLQFTGTTHAGIKLLSLTTAQRDALSASNGMIIYNSTTGELNQYIGGAWSAVASGSTQPTASTTVLGKIKTDVTPAGDPVALIADNPKYDALAGTSGTPSTSNKYVTNDDTATAATADKVARRLAGWNITVVTETTGNSTTNAASTAFVQQEITANGTKVNVSTTDTTVTGTASETTIYTTTVAANTLGTNNGVEGRIYFTSTNASTTDKVLKLKYGSTTIATVTMTPDANTALTFKGYIDFMVLWNASTSAQVGSIKINGVIARINTSNTQGIVEMSGAETGTATEDSTGALALTLSITQSSAETFVAKHAFLRKIK